MPRIPMLSLEEMTPEQLAVQEAYASGPRAKPISGPTLAAIHAPEIALRQQHLGAILRYGTGFPPRLSELAILVTARYWSAGVEWYHHAPAARRGGLAEEVIEAIRLGRTPEAMAADERAVYDFVRGMHYDKRVSDAVYQRVVELFGVTGVVELTALIGYYALVAININAHRLELPDGEPWPFPD